MVIASRFAAALVLVLAGVSCARADEAHPPVTWGAFVDTYYAWDASRPATFDRAYTTQPARHAEFNVNLAFVEARLASEGVRARLALQWGTSVQSNTAGEPRVGSVSGPDVSRFVQEATAGWRLAPTLWVDGGIFPAHVGYESWISRDNLAYTRSLIAEYSPYYESGARLTWTPSPALTTQLALVNGWQNVSAENSTPGAGVRVDWTLPRGVVLTYDNLIADVAADSEAANVRLYHDVIVQADPSPRWRVAAAIAFGSQSRAPLDAEGARWWGASVFARWQTTTHVAAVARVETLRDPGGVVVTTPSGASFETIGASLGVDVSPAPSLRWRTELRMFDSRDAVWPAREGGLARRSGFVVTSLGVSL